MRLITTLSYVTFTILTMTGCQTSMLAMPPMYKLGQLLDQGAVNLPRADVVALFEGRSLKTISPDNESWFDIRFSRDGTLSGKVHAIGAMAIVRSSSQAIGTWTVDDAGQMCADTEMPEFYMKRRWCLTVFSLGDQLVFSKSPTRREAAAGVRPRSDFY